MSIRDKPLVSVLTPVYNGALYLRECIESVLAQTYSNWEYIIVNNCSTDDTLQMADEYARRDPRIRVVTNPRFLDIIANHNHAFSLISPRSKYSKLLSADDWLFQDCLIQLVSVAEANPSVGIVGSYQLTGAGSDWRTWGVWNTALPYPSTFISGRGVCRTQMLTGIYVFGAPTALLYRSDLVRAHERFYPNSTPEADTSCCYRCLQTSDFGFVHQVLSYERVHEETVSSQRRSLNAYEASRLSDLVEYGPSFLTPQELQRRVEVVLHDYYKYLAASLFHLRGQAFWAYHKRRLEECRHSFSYLRLLRAVSAKVLTLGLNPLQTAEKIMRRLTRSPTS